MVLSYTHNFCPTRVTQSGALNIINVVVQVGEEAKEDGFLDTEERMGSLFLEYGTLLKAVFFFKYMV